jgi:hypothetical protein
LLKKIKVLLSLLVVSLLPLLTGCENNLTDEGISYISGDTLGTILLDSQVDTMNITANSFIKYITNYTTTNLLVGKYLDYESKTLLRFSGFPTNLDTATVVSATLNLRYNKVFYPDSLGVTSFNIYSINKYYDFTTLTYDNFYNEIGTTLLGTYTGTPVTDTIKISIPLDNQTVNDWFKYAHDTSYTNKNYGIILVPNANSTTIKSFHSYNNVSYYPDYIPSITTVQTYAHKVQDTLTFNYSEATVLNYVPAVNNPTGKFVVQNGIAIKDIMKFDLAKLPTKVIINQAVLVMKLDYANTFKSKSTDARLILNMLTDTSTLTNDGYSYYTTLTDSVTYTVYLNLAVQKWNNGTTNLGLVMKNVYEVLNLDRYVFYGPDYPDASLRPRLKIRYSKRN